MRLPILVLHIFGGTLGILSGFLAAFLRKGSRPHAIAGEVFVVSMLTMAAAGTTLAVMKSEPGNILGGTFTFYLVATAWMTARRSEHGISRYDWAGLAVVFAVAASELVLGTRAAMSPTGMVYDYPPGPYFFIGTVALLAFVGDVRLLSRKGISGTRRIARHLWRMCFGLFIASASLFLARQQLFPQLMRKSGTLILLSFLPQALLVYWLIRVRYGNVLKKRSIALRHA